MQKVNIKTNDEITSSEKISYQEIKTKNNSKISITNFFLNGITFISFSGLLILSWLSLIWLYKYHFVFTFYRYEKLPNITQIYFPIQINSFLLYFFIIFICISITITYILFLKEIIQSHSFDILNDKNKNYIIPITLNLFLFYIGELTHNKSDIFHIYYYIGFFSTIISLFYLIKLYYDADVYENDIIDFRLYVSNVSVYEFFYGSLITLDLYYLFYVTCQIIFHLYSIYNIKIYLGIIVNLCMGTVSLYICHKLKNMVIAFLFEIIFNGIIIFHYNFSQKDRENINLNYGEVISSAIFIVGFLIELIYIFIYKRNKIYYNI